jgi:coiled-coil family 90 protein
MSAVPFDTLKYAEALKTAGVPDAQAKAQVEALADVLRQGGQNLVTKADLKAELAELKAELKAAIAKLQTDIAWVKWIITGGVGLYVLRSIVEWLR